MQKGQNMHRTRSCWLVLVVVLAWLAAGADRAVAGPENRAPEVFTQPSAGLKLVAYSEGVGRTEPFNLHLPSDLAPGLLIHTLGNIQAFDAHGNPVRFSIVGVQVTHDGETAGAPVERVNFGGRPSLAFTDAQDGGTVILKAAEPALTFSFASGSNKPYSFRLLTTGVPEGGFLVFDQAVTAEANKNSDQ